MKENKTSWLGVLATEEEVKQNGLKESNCIVNGAGNLQFYLRVISEIPNQEPENKYVVCFQNKFTGEGIIDDNKLEGKERAEFYRKQLETCLFRFEYYAEDNISEKYKCKIAESIFGKQAEERYRQIEKFVTIPLITSENSSFENFEQLEKELEAGKEMFEVAGYQESDASAIPYLIFYDKNTKDEDGEYYVTNGVDKGVPVGKMLCKYFVRAEDGRSVVFIDEKTHRIILRNLNPAFRRAKEHQQCEWNFIRHFEQTANEGGLYYTIKDLINFHTAVKSSPLVILSGLSGTGKSQLVWCYAKALGLEKESLKMIPVRPNWSDDSDLIGFVDSMHSVYRPDDAGFVNTLIEASKPENQDKLYLICFDEMNLARVEHYFSQFLSILEMPEQNRFLKLYAKEYETRLYNVDKYPSSVKIGNNLRFIGTVNMDESTFHFSDKVLDRANVIQLDLVPYTEWGVENKNQEAKLEQTELGQTELEQAENEVWSYKKYCELVKELDLNKNILSAREREFLWKVHTALNSCSKTLGVGPRILKQIAKYLINLPKMEGEEAISRKEGFDIQFVQRILTKVRGQKEQLYDIFDENVKTSLPKLFEEYLDVSDFEKSKKMLEIKKRELENYGYTL